MRFEPRHAFRASAPLGVRATAEAVLPPELAFLVGQVGSDALQRAAAIARREQVCPLGALIANGLASEGACYRRLASHLGCPFEAGWPDIEPVADPGATVESGGVRLAGVSNAWLVAPRDTALRAILRCAADDLVGVVITTPPHLSALVHRCAQGVVGRRAEADLPETAPQLSAHRWSGRRLLGVAFAIAAIVVLGIAAAPGLAASIFGLLFLTGMVFRLMVSTEGLCSQIDPAAPTLCDVALPNYTVLVPLRQESDVLPELLDSLDALDYPRAKLEVLLLVEPEDGETRRALAARRLPPWLHVVLGPVGGTLRTKPRALNIGLDLARGTLITVYDAEDRPAPNQLRLAAARFAAEPALACLQAELAIDRPAGCRLARLFALEYATLYRLFNRGLARYDLPLPLGGTSNHFRTSVLRSAGGWDAWNVTEDADLGLRLARMGQRVDALASTTRESAPRELGVWMRQRRRWMKGWMQTGLVVASDAPLVVRQLGAIRAAGLALLLINLVVGPLALPLASVLLLFDLARYGLPATPDLLAETEATLAASVLLMGFVATYWFGLVGRGRSRLRIAWSDLALLPLYQLLIGLAAYAGLWDLLRRPFHWHKTPHLPSDEPRR